MKNRTVAVVVALVTMALLANGLLSCRAREDKEPAAGPVKGRVAGLKGFAQDEAMQKGVKLAFFDQAPNEPDYFRGMDGGGQFSPAEIRGRNTWMMWSGGNEAFWDWLANNSFGTFDLLKTLSSYPCSPEQEQRAKAYELNLQTASTEEGYGVGAYGQSGYATPPGTYEPGDKAYGVCAATMYPSKTGQAPFRYYSRDTRFCYLGLINEPGFAKATQPDEYGLCLDRPTGPAEPEEKTKIYGRASGVLGLRIFDNPNFDEKARKRWMEAMKSDAFYTDPRFFNDRNLVRPYRVAMACSFCHVSPHPLSPPANPESPQLANLSGTIGAQYFWFGRIFGPNVTSDNFVWHLLDSSRPGTVDTSFIPADNLNNPRALNAIFNVRERVANGEKRAFETSSGGALDLPELKEKGPSFGVPHILWDGADSVGVDAALTRVYINIGEYHQEWLRHISPIVGAGSQTPIPVKAAQENSIYWQATQKRAADMAAYLTRGGYPMPLAQAPGGAAMIDQSRLDRGKTVFAETCARCHSSKLPEQPAASGVPRLGEEGCIGSRYRECWDNYWRWTETPDFKTKMTAIVKAPDFLTGNYLSNDARIPVDVLKTEICSAMAPNAIAGHVWDNFSSQSYKELPSVGNLTLYDPVQGKNQAPWPAPAGGRGYTRVPSLVAIWSSAPYLHNNEIGTFTGDPSTKGRMDAFNDSIRKMLWPERRGKFVHRTDRVTYLKVSPAALPRLFQPILALSHLVKNGMVTIGPIPKGTPINLLSNINLDNKDPRFNLRRLADTLGKTGRDLLRIKKEKLNEQQATELLKRNVPGLLSLSACPDFIVDRGHEFGKDLSNQDKEALIEFVKTL
ncbi:MAG TPA: hypothetical protein VF756_18300 [Thermoanaerobaculia bacterium]